jgi:hypothetical protein
MTTGKTMSKLTAISDNLLCINGDFGEKRLASGIYLLNDDAKETGIRSRWFQVLDVGPQIRDELKPGYWVVVKHGRWTTNMKLPIDDYRDQLAQTLNCEPNEVESIINPSAKTNHEFMFWKVDYYDGVLGYYPGPNLPAEYIEGQAMTSSLPESQRVYSAKQSSSQTVNPGEV